MVLVAYTQRRVCIPSVATPSTRPTMLKTFKPFAWLGWCGQPRAGGHSGLNPNGCSQKLFIKRHTH